jgi:hypothetical protein
VAGHDRYGYHTTLKGVSGRQWIFWQGNANKPGDWQQACYGQVVGNRHDSEGTQMSKAKVTDGRCAMGKWRATDMMVRGKWQAMDVPARECKQAR